MSKIYKLDSNGRLFEFPVYYLPPKEYGTIVGEINTYYSKYEEHRCLFIILMIPDIIPSNISLKTMATMNITSMPSNIFTERLTMEELYNMLNSIQDTYFEFVDSVLSYAKKKPERLTVVKEYIQSHTNLTSADILYFISTRPDFFEDDVMNSSPREIQV